MSGTALPPLRDDLRFSTAEGRATIHDPVRNRYFRLPLVAARALAQWNAGTVENLCGRVRGFSPPDVLALINFLSASRLLRVPAGGVAELAAERERAGHSLPMRLVHNYLFFRVPLVRPQRFLDALLPVVAPLGGRFVRILTLVFGLLGLWLTTRQWDVFTTTFQGFFSLEGALLHGITLVFLKVFHELGHAFTARRFGCRVPVMGAAFMLMAPMLYTDVTDAWRLERRRQRVLIGAAGVLVELSIAAFALFFWAILADGAARSAAYFIATTAILASLLVNLAPFMRFDGYHILADLLGVENLGPRAFARGQWKLREVLFGLGAPPPEPFAPLMGTTLIAYAWATWLYRLALFIGIAALVYAMFPKAVGLPLFIIEILFFIARPIAMELKQWGEQRREIAARPRARWLFALCGTLLVLAILPLDRHVSVPAVILPANETQLFAPEPSRLTRLFVAAGDRVAAGAVLAELDAPTLTQKAAEAAIRLAIVEARLARIAGDAKDRALLGILVREQAALTGEIASLDKRRARLTLRATVTGRIVRLADGLAAGRWVGPTEPLVELIGEGGSVARGLAAEADVPRLAPGGGGRFIPDAPEASAATITLGGIGAPGGAGRELLYLASTHGGPIAATAGPDGRPVASLTVFPLTAVIDRPVAMAETGVLILEARPESALGAFFRRAAAVLLRESGF